MFEECQNTWKSENDNLRRLLFSDTDTTMHRRDGLSILPLGSVKAIIEDVLKEEEQNQRNYGNIWIISFRCCKRKHILLPIPFINWQYED